MSKLEHLRRERRRIASWLFLLRCMVAWLPIAAFHLFEHRALGPLVLILYVIGIPAGVVAYDRLVLKQR